MATLVMTPEIERDAQRLAAYKGVSAVEAIAEALRDKLREAEPSTNPRGVNWDRVDAIVARVRDNVDRSLTDDEILGYGPGGLPGEV